jgi:hypothetical protein
MKRFLPFMLSLVLALTLFTPVLAAGKGNSPFTLVGKITAIDPASRSITVQVLRGNVLVKPYLGQAVSITTTMATQFRYTDGTVTTIIKFSDLKVGDAVSASGRFSGGIWIASRITMGAKLDCLK